jgi:putative sterol carrier protein
MVFDRKAAGDAQASIQFCVSGDEPGDYHVRIAGGRCVSTEGRAPSADLTIYTPDAVWVRIAHGELDGGQALSEGLYRAEGDLAVLAKIGEWFPTRR